MLVVFGWVSIMGLWRMLRARLTPYIAPVGWCEPAAEAQDPAGLVIQSLPPAWELWFG